ncbi:APC family permease [Helcobacillus massiliensis]|uniref:APC family permease n=1 Tax=Helcobacillus massiliensis TaxID=521392 RepID=UPI0021A55B34|nr:APC family permease [Helcobacillus massiliensis]MCT1557709.1 APC family permease [Helcobacillus massiliensis]MCT2035981.1 APC family permease [Helcobacillus massiliensis]MCT2331749.1 APC family permease [Helcobacillus massiliensis]
MSSAAPTPSAQHRTGGGSTPSSEPPTVTGGFDPNEKAVLKREFKPQWVFAIALGSAIGWGSFILPVDWLKDGGTAGALMGMATGAVLISIIALSYGIVIKKFPVTGGELAYSYVAMGRRHSFVAGWFLTLGYISIVALNASALALVVRNVAPSLMEQGRLWEVAGWPIYLPEVAVSIGALLLFTFFNARGTALSGRVQYIACIIMLACVSLLLLLSVIAYIRKPVPLFHAFPSDTAPWAAIMLMVAIAPFAFVGFDNVPQLAGEFDFSPSKALKLILFAIGAAAFIYLAMLMAASIAISEAGHTFEGHSWATADAIRVAIGPVGPVLMVVGVTMGVITGLNGFMLSASRVLLAMADARMVPGQLGYISHRAGTPVVALLFVLAFCVVTPFFGREALNWVVDMTSAGVSVAYFYTCLCAFKAMRRTAAEARDGIVLTEPRTSPGWIAFKSGVAVLGCVLSVVFLALLFIPGSPGQLDTPPLIALAIWIAIGFVFYLSRRRALNATTEEEMDRLVLGEHAHAKL